MLIAIEGNCSRNPDEMQVLLDSRAAFFYVEHGGWIIVAFNHQSQQYSVLRGHNKILACREKLTMGRGTWPREAELGRSRAPTTNRQLPEN